MSAPAHPARMEQNATTGPMGSSAAVLKVRASVFNTSEWKVPIQWTSQGAFTGRRADET